MADQPAHNLAEVELAIVRAISEQSTILTAKLTDVSATMGERIQGLELRVEGLTTSTTGWQHTIGRQLSDMERRIGGNEQAIKGVMAYAEKSSAKAVQADNDIRDRLALARSEMEKFTSSVAGERVGVERLQRTLQWGIGLIVAIGTIIGMLVALQP